jgi:phage terminase large subunit-like protein
MANARKAAKPNQQYVLIKPADHQKIDAVMARILAHTAAADSREAGWGEETDSRMFVFR